jgi:hypothetical protein
LRLGLVAGPARQLGHRERVREPFPLNPACIMAPISLGVK